MKRVLLLFLLVAVYPNLLKAQKLVTDRPDQTESAETLVKQSLQIESGVIWESALSGYYTGLSAPTILLRFGLTDFVELRFVQSIVNINYKPNWEGFGFTDSEIGFKAKLFTNQNATTNLAILSHVIIPNGTKVYTNNNLGITGKLAFSHSLSQVIGFGYNLGYSYYTDDYHGITYSTTLGFDVNAKFGAFLELYGIYKNNQNKNLNFDLGLTFQPKNTMQWDISMGIDSHFDTYFLSAGFSKNFKR